MTAGGVSDRQRILPAFAEADEPAERCEEYRSGVRAPRLCGDVAGEHELHNTAPWP